MAECTNIDIDDGNGQDRDCPGASEASQTDDWYTLTLAGDNKNNGPCQTEDFQQQDKEKKYKTPQCTHLQPRSEIKKTINKQPEKNKATLSA